MSPRVNRRRPSTEATGSAVRGVDLVESWPEGDWVVRAITAAATGKTFRCPGCDQEILPATPHVVAWPAGGGGAEDRRHWHRPCWTAHGRRGVKVRRSRDAPHFG